LFLETTQLVIGEPVGVWDGIEWDDLNEESQLGEDSRVGLGSAGNPAFSQKKRRSSVRRQLTSGLVTEEENLSG